MNKIILGKNLHKLILTQIFIIIILIIITITIILIITIKCKIYHLTPHLLIYKSRIYFKTKQKIKIKILLSIINYKKTRQRIKIFYIMVCLYFLFI
jgi:hypothetical protein